MSDNLKWDKQCSEAVIKANRILGMIKRNFADNSKETIIPLYKSLVRPHLEYCWYRCGAHIITDMKLLEGVQRRATRFGHFVGILFPVLDLLRLVVRDATANKYFCDSQSSGPRLVNYACAVFNNSLSAQPKNELLMLRALCNAFQHAAGKQLMLDSAERLLASAKVALQGGADKLLQVKTPHYCLCT